MGLVRKPTIAKYWRKNDLSCTPFFGRYMTRMQFEAILSNLHLNDNTQANEDPLYKLRPMIDMVDCNFLHVYTPDKNLSVDVASCALREGFPSKCIILESHADFTSVYIKFARQNQGTV